MNDSKESMTAKICSFARAYHSNYSRDKIFDDYLAYDIMGKDEYEQIGSLIYHNFNYLKTKNDFHFKNKYIKNILSEYVTPILLSRIRFTEDKLQKFVENYSDCQYVICGAGFDTFAFRNNNPDIQIYEIDHPATQNYKLQRICELEWNIPKNVHFVSVDFENNDMKEALLKSGFDVNKKTFFSILGVSYYLTLPVFEETFKNISELSTDGNMLLFDYPDETTLRAGKDLQRISRLSEITAYLGESMQDGFTYKSLANALEKNSFIVEEHLTPLKIQTNYFNGRTDSYRAFENVHFISAVYRKEAYKI